MKNMKLIVAKRIAEKAIRGNVNSACVYINYQPVMPSGVEKFKK